MLTIFQKIFKQILIITLVSLLFTNQSFSLTKSQKNTIILCKETSEFFDVDDIVPVLCGIESSFGINKTGDNGKSHGIMQIRFSTAKWILSKNNLHFEDSMLLKLLYDDKFNIMIGCTYLRYLIKTFKGDKNKAILAYNVGVTNVKRYGINFDPNEYLDKFHRIKLEINNYRG